MLGHGAISQFAISEWTTTVTVPETITMDKWYRPLSEPPRFLRGVLPGMRPSLQQFFAGPPRLLPTPSITATMAAVESGDLTSMTVLISQSVATAKVGIVELKPITSPVGLFEIKQ